MNTYNLSEELAAQLLEDEVSRMLQARLLGYTEGQKKAKKEDPVEDLYKKVQAENQAKIEKSQKDLEKQNIRTKTLQETTTMKWIPNSEGSTQGSFQRVDAKGNIYTPEPGKEYKKIFDPQAVIKSIMR